MTRGDTVVYWLLFWLRLLFGRIFTNYFPSPAASLNYKGFIYSFPHAILSYIWLGADTLSLSVQNMMVSFPFFPQTSQLTSRLYHSAAIPNSPLHPGFPILLGLELNGSWMVGTSLLPPTPYPHLAGTCPRDGWSALQRSLLSGRRAPKWSGWRRRWGASRGGLAPQVGAQA